jgi:hypothetical protein
MGHCRFAKIVSICADPDRKAALGFLKAAWLLFNCDLRILERMAEFMKKVGFLQYLNGYIVSVLTFEI